MNAAFRPADRLESAATRFALYAVAVFVACVAAAVAAFVGMFLFVRLLITLPGLIRSAAAELESRGVFAPLGLSVRPVPATPDAVEVPAVATPTPDTTPVDPAAWDYLASYAPPAVAVATPTVETHTIEVPAVPFGWGSLDLPTLPTVESAPTPDAVAVAEVKPVKTPKTRKPAATKTPKPTPKTASKPTRKPKATPKPKPKPKTAAVAKVAAERKPGKAKPGQLGV